MATSFWIAGDAALGSLIVPAMAGITGSLRVDVSFRFISQPVRSEISPLVHMPLCHAGQRGNG